jgi:hypothetical protein
MFGLTKEVTNLLCSVLQKKWPICYVRSYKSCPSKIFMRSELRLLQATRPDYTNQPLYGEPTRKNKQHKQPFINDDRHKP